MTRRMTRTVTHVTRVVDVLALVLALFAPMPVDVSLASGVAVPAGLVECWEDLACSGGSTMDR